MGKKGRQFEYKEERDRNLISVYRSVINRMPATASLYDILYETVNTQSTRFWVSVERAFKVVGDIRAGKDLSTMNENKRLMFSEIERRVSELQKSDEYKTVDLFDIIASVIEQPAPCFYMTPESAKVIIHYIKKKCLQERLKRLRFLH